jgi:5-methylcytosine-specific restriction endonuclease McrA
MNGTGPKRPRITLAPDAYEQLRRRVLERDNWRCQNCGSLKNLQVHHKTTRSQLGDDAEFNLITLCDSCHSSEHG